MSNHHVLNNAEHLELRVRTEPGAELGDGVMACLTVPAEFRQLQGEFPIVFRRDIESGRFAAMALMGFEQGENLFLDGARWTARNRPLALAIQPFLIGRPARGDGEGEGEDGGEDGGEAQVHVDMDHPRIATGGEGMRVFGDDGRPTPYLEDIAQRLGALHAGYQESAAFFAALERHDLLEPFSLEVPLRDGSRHALVGFHIINEDRLAALDGAALAELSGAGHLAAIFMAMASQAQFAALAARKNARVGLG